MSQIDRKDRLRMYRPVRLIALVAALAAGASAHAEEMNKSLYSVNQPVVQRSDYAIDLRAQGGSLDPYEEERLEGWFRSLQVGYGDRVFVEGQDGREGVARAASRYGLLLSDGYPITTGQVQPGSVRVIVSRATASVPGCPDWKGRSGAGSTSPNYGCATNSNLAAMIADPNDLVLGQSTHGGADPYTSTRAVDAYRRRAPSGSSGEVKTESAKGEK
jgi:pilus assembly protein CpaD